MLAKLKSESSVCGAHSRLTGDLHRDDRRLLTAACQLLLAVGRLHRAERRLLRAVGDLDECEITDEERVRGVDVRTLVTEPGPAVPGKEVV